MKEKTTRRKWEVNEIAFLEFCRFKGLKYGQIITLLEERSYAAANAMGWKVSNFKEGKHDPTDSIIPTINQALILEAQVRSGAYPDMKASWLSKISKVTGIKYAEAVGFEPEEEVEPEQDEEVSFDMEEDLQDSCDSCSTSDEKEAVADNAQTDLITIKVNMKSVLDILSIIFGK